MRTRHASHLSRKSAPVLLLGVFALVASPSPSQAAVYGCSIAGQWQCYPSPQRCYKNASYLAVVKFANYEACKARK
jgi:hypothetical protein